MQSATEIVTTAGRGFRWVMSALLGLNFLAIFVTILAIVEREPGTDFPVIPPAPDWAFVLLFFLFVSVAVLTVVSMVVGIVTSGAEAMTALDEYT